MAERRGMQIGHYHLIRLLGQGGCAEVYLGQQLQLGTQAAVKLWHVPLPSLEEVERFRHEARTLATLSHPHLVHVLDFGVRNGLPYLVLEYAPGGSVRERHPPGMFVPLATVVAYVQQLAQGLQYAHDQQVIHRNITPRNLLLGGDGELLLTGFSLSVGGEHPNRPSAHGFAGTVAYAAPEQLQGHPGPASDQYALGGVVYEWLSGQLPFTGSFWEVAAKQLLAAPSSWGAQGSALPLAVEQVVLRALAKAPQDRFASVQAFAHALTQASQMESLPPDVLTSALPAPFPALVAPELASPQPSATHSWAETEDGSLSTPPAGEAVEFAWSLPRVSAEWPLPTPVPRASGAPSSPQRSRATALPQSPSWRGWVLLALLGVLLSSSVGLGFWLAQRHAPAQLYPQRGLVADWVLPTAGSDPGEIITDPDGALWFTEFGSNRIGRLTPGGSISEFALPTATSTTDGITVGPDGALWFTEARGNRIGRLAPGGFISEFTLPTAQSYPEGITAGPDGALWFTEQGSGQIGRLTPSGSLTEFALPIAQSEPEGITAGSDGALWFTEAHGNRIGRLTPGGSISEFALPTPGNYPARITAGPDGALWFTEADGNRIGHITPGGFISEFTLPTAQSNPWGITAGPDGALWFTEAQGNRIGRLMPDGSLTEWAVPTPNSDLWGITAGSDGNQRYNTLWFTEAGNNRIGRLTTGGS